MSSLPYDPKFDGIRPYYDSELPAAMERITRADAFPLLASWVFPDMTLDSVRRKMLALRSVEEFQHAVMVPVNEQVIKRSISHFTHSGLERLDAGKNYLFVSNHRDIMLDACLLNYLMATHGRHTTQITFGANLMTPGLITDIGKCNKMFRVERGGRMADFYQSSQLLSSYLRETLVNRGESVWIAQRNGRTKDGLDRTDPGIINMFAMSLPGDKLRALAELNIVPVCMSYEWESCDVLKALELYGSRRGKYIKRPGEDLNSIITGLLQQKGDVHIAFGEPITLNDLEPLDNLTNSSYRKAVAAMLDNRINKEYVLKPNNFIAHDLRYGQSKYSDKYSCEQRNAFVKRLDKLNEIDAEAPDELLDIFLAIYANPVNIASEKPK